MKLRVSHRTTYRYDLPQRHVLQSQRLVPSVYDGQKIVDWSVDVPGGRSGCRFRDGAGDVTTTVRIPGPVSEILVETAGIVETEDLAGVLRGHREGIPPQVYLQSTRATRVDVGLMELAEKTVEGMGNSTILDRAHALNAAVRDAVAYIPGSTGAQTTASEALAQKQGVCQDHAHVLVAAARVLEIPARYVTGYLFASAEEATAGSMGAEASHAWAELFVERLGWVGFDPSNGGCPDDRYIRLCSGLDSFDAAPIRGLAAGTGEEVLDVVVAVQAVQQ